MSILIPKELRYSVYTLSGILGTIIIFFPILTGIKTLNECLVFTSIGIPLPYDLIFNTSVIFGLILICIPIALINYLEDRYVRSLEDKLPDFFKELAESTRAGLSLPQALEDYARRERESALGKELNKVVIRYKLRADFEDAVKSLAKRIPTTSVQRAYVTLVEAYRSGGRMTEVLDSAARIYSMIRDYEQSKRGRLKHYVWIIYMSVFLFSFIAVIIMESFIRPTAEIGKAVGGTFIFGTLDERIYEGLFFLSSLVQSIMGGFIAGKIVEGSATKGIKHVIIMLIAVAFFFSILSIILRGYFESIIKGSISM
ncbi:MAG: hypothetical protein DRJ52_02520 [Thermoprotei archaeon]|nr:MAG: hypothetical protein DRJ52_02520 [Thermoprotei archaeon]RLF00638.1 MAG: hypothetical protein DRJ63_01730 [Thermoprotei archaeon]